MTTEGVLVASVIGLVILLWVIKLVRRDRLYAGYGVIFVFGTIAAMTVVVVPPLREAATAASEALLPVPSLSLMAIVILTFLMVYVFIQISVLANRVIKLTQELAIRDARKQGDMDSRPR